MPIISGLLDVAPLMPLVAVRRDPGTHLTKIKRVERLYGLSGRFDAYPIKCSSMWLKKAHLTLSAPRSGPAFVPLHRVAPLSCSGRLCPRGFHCSGFERHQASGSTIAWPGLRR